MDKKKRQNILLILLAIIAVWFLLDYFFLSKTAPDQVVAKSDDLATDTIAVADLSQVVVYVTGAVNKPGIVKLSGESRVIDAVNAAGGLAVGADATKVNLATKLQDGMQINIPGALVLDSTVNGSGSAKSEMVNINSAGLNELDKLPGIGPALAQRIIDYRQAKGAFKTIEDIKKVSGIGDAKFSNIKEKITI